MLHIGNRAQKSEFGDFQTPARLASAVCELLARTISSPATIIEPTCGVGNFLFAAVSRFSTASRTIGLEINPEYIARALSRVQREFPEANIELQQADFFGTNWEEVLSNSNQPILVVGNPPWVTNAHLSKLGSSNVPQKSNQGGLSGFDAISGKSNFDISEWMLRRLIELLDGRRATLAMLCKTSVARKLAMHIWKSRFGVESISMHLIDSEEHFGASVDACLFVCVLQPAKTCAVCRIYPELSSDNPSSEISYDDGSIIANTEYYERWKCLVGKEWYKWRSGIKHDCSRVMELRSSCLGYVNGLGERVDIEDTHVYPMLKSSDLANGSPMQPRRYMLVTQRAVGEDTRLIEHVAPKTWQYLQNHAALLDKRGSSIYSNQSRFAIFGVGDYSFSPWKVAISGLYKNLRFRVVSPSNGRPVMLDDTCYFIGCGSEEEAEYLASLLNSEPAYQFFSAFVFPDSKRPITADLLRRLDLLALANAVGSGAVFEGFQMNRASVNGEKQLSLLAM